MDSRSYLTKFSVFPPRRQDNGNGFYAWWTFDDGTGTDFSGNGVFGSLVSGTVNPLLSDGKIGNSLLFHGSTGDGYISGGATPSLSELTFTAWIKATALSNTYSVFLKISNLADGFQTYIKSNGKLAFYILRSSAGSNYDGTGANTLVTNIWYHVAFTYVTAIGGVGYVNGAVDGTLASLGALNLTSTMVLTIDLTTPGRQFAGYIDDVRVYSRALSANEINAIYNQGIAYQSGFPETEMPMLRAATGRSFVPSFLG